jgi:outer membrane protein OmpA-like peptidoglycan-associated protein
MRKTLILSALVSVGLLQGTAAWADPAYRASDIVKRFAPANLGSTRGLCIGTEADCAAPKATATEASFDLLVNFDYDSDILTGDARRNLDEFAKALKDPRLKAASFVVEGHTDGKGSDAYNLSLSDRRAKAVVSYLAEQGVDTSKIVPRGFGKAKPRTNDPFDAMNRRVETRLRVD